MPNTKTISHDGKTYHHAARVKTTPKSDTSVKKVYVKVNNAERQKTRLEENKEYLKNPNVKAFLDTIAQAEGGDYDFKYGAVKGRKNDKWRITDYSLPPQKGSDGRTTSSGRYQINLSNWTENGKGKMGLVEFSPETQDLIAVEGLRQIGAIDAVVSGDMTIAIGKAAKTWNSLPLGKDMKNRVQGQPYIKYEDVLDYFKNNGGKITKE